MSTHQDTFTVSLTHDIPFGYIFAQVGASEAILATLLNDFLMFSGEEKIISLMYREASVLDADSAERQFILFLRIIDRRGVERNVGLRRDLSTQLSHQVSAHQVNTHQVSAHQVNTHQASAHQSNHSVNSRQRVDPSSYDESLPTILLSFRDKSRASDIPLSLDQLACFSLDGEPLPYRVAEFEALGVQLEPHIRKRIEEVEEAMDFFKRYTVQLDLDPSTLTPDQEAWVRYLNAELSVSRSGDEVSVELTRCALPEGVSEETRRHIEEAQARLERAEGLPERLWAYETERASAPQEE